MNSVNNNSVYNNYINKSPIFGIEAASYTAATNNAPTNAGYTLVSKKYFRFFS
jgi:hypothetical protein